MNKEQIQQKFEEILKGLGWTFREDGVLNERYTLQEDVEELMINCFNLGLHIAAGNAEADFNSLTENAEIQMYKLIMNKELEVCVIKNSILKFKL